MGQFDMHRIKLRKTLLVGLIIATALAPLFFVGLDEAGTRLAVVKLLAKVGSLSKSCMS